MTTRGSPVQSSIDKAGRSTISAAERAVCEEVSLEDSSAWTTAVSGLPHAIAHTWPYVRAIQATSGFRTYLLRFARGDSSVVCPLAERSFAGRLDITTPYGFAGYVSAGEPIGFAEASRRFALEHGYVCGYVALHPQLEGTVLGEQNERFFEGHAYVLDLTLTEEALHSRLSRNRQRQFRTWGRGGETIVSDSNELAAFFIDHYRSFMTERGAAAVYRFSRETLESLVTLEGTLLVGAARNGHIEAVQLFGYTPYGADYLFAASRPEGRAHSAAIVWHAALELRARGIPWLNLGGGIRDGDAVAVFKERFGGLRCPLIVLKQVYDPDAYASLCASVGADPADRTGYFPPWWRP